MNDILVVSYNFKETNNDSISNERNEYVQLDYESMHSFCLGSAQYKNLQWECVTKQYIDNTQSGCTWNNADLNYAECIKWYRCCCYKMISKKRGAAFHFKEHFILALS